MQRYIGMDAHGASCTFAVIGPSGRKIRHDVVETNGAALVSYLKGLAGQKHLCLEEGTQSAWLYEILLPHVDELVVTGPCRSRGQKSDVRDALQLAEQLRTNAIRTPVFKAPRRFTRLRELARGQAMLVQDVVRVKNRLKAAYRARGVSTAGGAVYSPRGREDWLSKLPAAHRTSTARLHEQHDLLLGLRNAATADMLAEARKHPIARTLATAPGMGPIRVAHLLPIVVEPRRFRSRSQFWAYCGLAVVTRSSSDYVQSENGTWRMAPVRQTRGLNRNHVSRLKSLFKGAALTVVTQLPGDPLHEHYLRLTAAGTKPSLARLTIARRIAAIVLRMWKDGKEYDPKIIRAKHEDIASPDH